jgi:hypothetical protein
MTDWVAATDAEPNLGCQVSAYLFYIKVFFQIIFNRIYSLEYFRADKLTKTFPCGIPHPTRTQATRCGNTFAYGCFDFGVRPGTWRGSALSGLHRQSNLPQSLHRPWLLQSFYPIIQCNCGACNVPSDARHIPLTKGRITQQSSPERDESNAFSKIVFLASTEVKTLGTEPKSELIWSNG